MLTSKTEYEHQVFTGLSLSAQQITASNFLSCVFKNCNMFQADLSGCTFTDCTFTGCDLSMVILKATHFNNVEFNSCKLTGDNFEFCNFNFNFCANFTDCILELTNFSGAKIHGCSFNKSSFKKARFIGAKLTKCDFSECDFDEATFDGADLSESNFKRAIHYAIDPTKNKLKKTIFSVPEVVGLLSYLDIKIE